MALIEKESRRLIVDLTGEGGNAYSLLGLAKSCYKQLDEAGILDFKEVFHKDDGEGERITFEEISAEMRSGDYENLLKVFGKYFGEYVDLER